MGSDVMTKEVEEVINVSNNPDHKTVLHFLFNGKMKEYADRRQCLRKSGMEGKKEGWMDGWVEVRWKVGKCLMPKYFFLSSRAGRS